MPTAALIVKGSLADFYSQGGAPANPPSGQARTYYDGTLWHAIDSTGADVAAVSASGLPSSGTWNAGTLTISGNPTFSGFLLETPQNSITAAGNNQGTAAAITTANAIVTTTASGTGVILPVAIAGMLVTVTNNGANTLLVYPQSGAQIDSLSANSSGAIPAAQTVGYYATDSTHWISIANGAQAGNSITVTHQLGGMNIIALSSTPALGTPASGTLTNCTGLPAASVVAGTLSNMVLTKPTITAVAAADFPLNNVTPFMFYDGSLAGWVEEFLNVATTTVSAATGCACDMGWSCAPITGGTTGTIIADGTNDGIHIGTGIMNNVPAVSGDGIALYKGGGANSMAPLGILGALAGWQIDVWVKSDSTITNYCARVGYCVSGQQVADPPTGGSWFDTDTANAALKGGCLTHGSITAGSSYTTGTYTNVPITGGTGTGALATIVVAAGGVTTVTFTTAGTGYLSTDTGLSAASANIGGTGSGFSFPLATVTQNWNFRTVNGSSPTYTDTGITLATSTWYHFRIYCNVAGTLKWQAAAANGALSAAVSTSSNVDTTHACMPWISCIPRTTQNSKLAFDRYSYVAITTRV